MSSHNNSAAKKFDIEERRRRVASLLAKCHTQTQIAKQLGVDQSTISDDIKALRLMSQRFIYDLAKSDLGFYYKQCIDGIEEAKKEAWVVAEQYGGDSFDGGMKYKLKALDIIVQAEQAKFKLLTEGPNILSINAMSQRLDQIEQSIVQEQEEANR